MMWVASSIHGFVGFYARDCKVPPNGRQGGPALAANPFRVLSVVCGLPFSHYAAAQMRGPILPLYVVTHGASATGVGLILGAHMMVAAVGSTPLGRASAVWGRPRFLLGGMIVSIGTSLLLPLTE